MREARRKPSRPVRRRAVPERPRAPLSALATLRHGREALTEIQAQLDALLGALRSPEPAIDADAPARLAGATVQAGRALAMLDELRRLVPTRA